MFSPERVPLSSVHFPFQFPQTTAQLLGLRLDLCLLRFDVTPHPSVLLPPAALDALPQRRTLSQELLFPRAPHLVQVDGTFTLSEAHSCSRSATGDKGKILGC